MDMLFIAILGTLLSIYFIVGVIASAKVHTNTDYFLAGKSLTVPAITATLLATQIGGGMFLGTAQDPFRGMLYIIGMVIGFLVLGLGVASKLQALKVTTIAEIFEKSYKSQFLSNVTALLSAASMFGIIIAQIVAAKSILLHFAGIDNPWLFVAFWAFVIGYTMLGGLAAVVMTDAVQILFIITVFTGICLYTFFTNPIPFFTQQNYDLARLMIQESGLTFAQAFRIISMPVFFSVIEQDLAQRFFAAKTKQTAALAALCAGALLLLFAFVPFYLGMLAQLLNIEVPFGVNPLLPVLKHITNPLFFVLAVCAILSAITSTADSLLCAVSAVVTTSIISHSKKAYNTVFVSRIITLLCGVAALTASWYMSDNVIGILIDSYEISVSCLFIPLVCCFIIKDLHEHAALTSSLFGFLGFMLFKITCIPAIHPYSIVITLGLSALGYWLGHTMSLKTTHKRF